MSNGFEDALKEVPALVRDGAVFSALVNVGCVLASVGDSSDHETVRRARSLLADLDEARLSAAQLEASQVLERLQRLTHYAGSKYEVEEVVLMLTMRLKLALAMFAASSLFGVVWPYDLSDCDSALQEIARSHASRAAYGSSVALIEKNWRRKIPFSVEQLGVAAIWNAGTSG